MPRISRNDLSAHADSITNDAAFQQVVGELKKSALQHLEKTSLKAYGQDNLERDRAIIEYQVVCEFEKKFNRLARGHKPE